MLEIYCHNRASIFLQGCSGSYPQSGSGRDSGDPMKTGSSLSECFQSCNVHSFLGGESSLFLHRMVGGPGGV